MRFLKVWLRMVAILGAFCILTVMLGYCLSFTNPFFVAAAIFLIVSALFAFAFYK